MNVNNNNLNINNASFKSNSGEKPMTFERNTLMNTLMTKCKEELSSIGELQLPENGKFLRLSLGFEIPQSDNMGMFIVDYDPDEPRNKRILSVGVHHKNSDRMVSNIVANGTKKEILEYIKSQENTQELVDLVDELSKKTDDFHNSL